MIVWQVQVQVCRRYNAGYNIQLFWITRNSKRSRVAAKLIGCTTNQVAENLSAVSFGVCRIPKQPLFPDSKYIKSHKMSLPLQRNKMDGLYEVY
jgi:hypothetical protein